MTEAHTEPPKGRRKRASKGYRRFIRRQKQAARRQSSRA